MTTRSEEIRITKMLESSVAAYDGWTLQALLDGHDACVECEDWSNVAIFQAAIAGHPNYTVFYVPMLESLLSIGCADDDDDDAPF